MSTNQSTPRKQRTITVPFNQEKYSDTVKNSRLFRQNLNEFINLHPELFPPEIKNGYLMKDMLN